MDRYPFLHSAFDLALHDAGVVGAGTAWQVCHRRQPMGQVPLYLRHSSRGEYVFDFSWAEAYQRHGLAYYPKLVTAVPYTPVVGPRWSGSWSADNLWQEIASALEEHQASGWHLLFPDAQSRQVVAELPLVARQACHFRWVNRDYGDFEDFLATFQSRKRKNLRKERRRIGEQGLQIDRWVGEAISPQLWSQFYVCYANTYYLRGQRPYLPPTFFEALAQSELREQMLLVTASENGQLIASALYFFDAETLYGRYWGCKAERDCLHFELCYYQGIEFAIEKGLRAFDPGVQGEHKLLRGFEPEITWSYHYLANQEFQRAVAQFCKEEARQVTAYFEEARHYLPFRKAGGN